MSCERHGTTSVICRYCDEEVTDQEFRIRNMTYQQVDDVLMFLLQHDELLEHARKDMEDKLVALRDARVGMAAAGNGFVVKERDGTPSSVIRVRTLEGFKMMLRACLANVRSRDTGRIRLANFCSMHELNRMAMYLTLPSLQIYTVVRMAQRDFADGNIRSLLSRVAVDLDKIRPHCEEAYQFFQELIERKRQEDIQYERLAA